MRPTRVRPRSDRSARRRSWVGVLAPVTAVALVLPTAGPALAEPAESTGPADHATTVDPQTGDAPGTPEAPGIPGVTPQENSPLSDLDPGPAPQRGVLRTEVPDNSGLPDGVSVQKVEWITDRWVKLYITSPSMPEAPVKVQVHLARDWYSHPEKTFPSMWMLGPLYSSEDESAWSYSSDAVRFYADKNVNLVLPIGGGGSFFSDWQQPDAGKNFQWESFLTRELPPILKKNWRTNDRTGIAGLSMGATGAAILAGRHPEQFNFMASYSGYLDTSSPGMPEMFGMIDKNAGFDTTKMWGPNYSSEWFAHDPKLLARNMRDTSVYVSAGTGFQGNWDGPGVAPGLPENIEMGGMELGSRVTSQTFVNAAKLAGVKDLQVRFRPNGTHTWPYWEYDMHESWPYAAKALGLGEGDSSVECTADGKFAEAVDRYRHNQNNYDLGDCISDVYEIRNDRDEVTGTAQDFRGGVLYLRDGRADDPEAGADQAVATWGRTSAKYRELGGPNSWLGWPVEPDSWGKDGGAWARFDNGFIYWSAVQGDAGPVTMRMDVYDNWEETGYEYGPWGYPVTEEKDITFGGKTGQIQYFEDGFVVRTPDKKVHRVNGAIARRYDALTDSQRERLGFPTGDISTAMQDKGWFTDFEGGVLYWSGAHGSALVYRDNIFRAYGDQGYEGGHLGFPVHDEIIRADGGRELAFENGTLVMDADGKVTERNALDDKFDSLPAAQQDALGRATGNGTSMTSPQGTKGTFRDYEHGVIYTSDKGTYVFMHGALFDAYRDQGFESGDLGFITGDYTEKGSGDDRTASVTFEGGTLTLNADGTVTTTVA